MIKGLASTLLLFILSSATHIENLSVDITGNISRHESAQANNTIEDHDKPPSILHPSKSLKQLRRSFDVKCQNCSSHDQRIAIGIRDAFQLHGKALQSFTLKITQGNSLFKKGRNQTPEDSTRLIIITNQNATETDRRAVVERVPALMDALVGTSLEYSQRPIRLSDTITTFQIQDERICNENLWRLYKLSPCRSFSGVMALAKPERLRTAFGKEIFLSGVRHTDGRLSVETKLTLTDMMSSSDEAWLETGETCDLTDMNIFTLTDNSKDDGSTFMRVARAGQETTTWRHLYNLLVPKEQTEVVDLMPKVVLSRDELGSGDCVRCNGVLKYNLDVLSDSSIGSVIEIRDRWHTFMRPQNILESVWDCNGNKHPVNFDFHFAAGEQRTKDVIFKAPITAKHCSIKIAFAKDMPLWTDFTYLFEGGWELPPPVYKLLGVTDQSVDFGTSANWILFPILDITAFFNTVTFASLGAMMMYSKSLKEAVLPITI